MQSQNLQHLGDVFAPQSYVQHPLVMDKWSPTPPEASTLARWMADNIVTLEQNKRQNLDTTDTQNALKQIQGLGQSGNSGNCHDC